MDKSTTCGYQRYLILHKLLYYGEIQTDYPPAAVKKFNDPNAKLQ